MHHPGTKWKFNYPRQFVSLPEYTAHAGQTVEIVRALREGVEYDDPAVVLGEGHGSDAMFEVRAPDGWTGHAWASELEQA